MKKILSLLLMLFLLVFSVAAEASDVTLIDSDLVGVWIENDGYGTLTLYADGTAVMIYYDDTVTSCGWELTETGGRFLEGMWYNSPMYLENENTLNVSNGWMVFTREGAEYNVYTAEDLNATPVGEDGVPFLGTWDLELFAMGDMTMDPALLDVEMSLIFTADGIVTSIENEVQHLSTWAVVGDTAIVDGMFVTISEEGKLIIDDGEAQMIFIKNPDADVANPEADVVNPEADVVNPEADVVNPEADVVNPEADVVNPEADVAPVGDDGAPFIGAWYLELLVLDGMEMNPALLGMNMSIEFFADGTVATDDGEGPVTSTWTVENGAALVDGMPMTISSEGKLVLDDGEAQMIFGQEPAAAGTELSEEEQLLALLGLLGQMELEDTPDLPEELQSFVGEWYLCYIATGGLSGDLRTLGVTASLSLYDDCTGYLLGIADEYGEWNADEAGIIRFGESGTPMFLLGDETSPAGVFLQYGTEQSGYMIFHQDENAQWDPAAYTLASLDTLVPGTAATAPASDGADRLNIKYVCTQYTTAGFKMDASTLGAEYALLFHEGGTADLTLAGFTVEKLPYTISEDGMYVIDYYGSPFTCTPTEAGFDMDYYGTMMMHFVPET